MSDHTSTDATAARVIATPAAERAIRELVAERGELTFFQSGGCCDGSLPISRLSSLRQTSGVGPRGGAKIV